MRLNLLNKFHSLMVSASFLLVLTLIVPPTYAGGLEGINQTMGTLNEKKDTFLDNVEDFMRNTGLADLRNQIAEDYGVKISPYFKTRYDLTSNVFKAPDTGSGHTDNIWSFTPGFQWTWKNALGVVGGAYEATFKYFTKFSEQNEQDQKFLIYANLFPTDDTYVRISEKIDQRGATAGSSAFKPVNYLDNTLSVVAGYKINEDLTAEFGYENFDRDYSTAIARRYSYNEDRYNYRVYYRLAEKARVYTGFKHGQVDFYKMRSRDTFYFEFPVGIEASLPSGFNLIAAAGLHRRNLENASRNDLTHIVTNIAIRKGFNDNKTNLNFGFLRRPVESSFSTATTYDEKLWYANLRHLINPKLRARTNIYVGNRDFEERVLLGSRVVAGGAVFVVNPESVKRSDTVFGYGFGFDYNVRKWWVLHADYQYSRRNSNISALDFTENVMSLRSTIRV